MENSEQFVCSGCLSTDRNTVLLEQVCEKDLFLQIINEIAMPESNEASMQLCWECQVFLKRFSKFKKQVGDSYKILQAYTAQELRSMPSYSQLRTQKLFSLSISPDTKDTEINLFEVIKSEETVSKVKEEPLPDATSVYSDYSEDDKFLIEMTTKRRKKNKRVVNGVKRKRKKHVEADKIKTEIYREIELNRVEIEEERRLLAAREEFVNAMFRCDKCLTTFPNADDLKDHENIKHLQNASSYKCDICECWFASEVSYNYHSHKHRRRYECAACMDRYVTKRGAARHYDNTHRTGADYGVNNGQLNGVIEELENGENDRLKTEAPSFPCEFCNKTFRWKTSLRKHLETHRIATGQKRKPYCEPCRMSFTTTSNLQKHVKTSSKHQIQLKLRKLKESLADGSTTPEKHQAHIEQIKSSVNSARQTHTCGQCGKRFQWRGNLLRHLDSHAARANGELVCEPCNRTFSSIATYKQHMKISKKHVTENEFKYMCSDCGKRFANKTRLKDHVDWEHLKNYVHKCSLCQKVFKSHTSLYLHRQVVHKKDSAEHLCDHCGKAFPNHAKLRSHIIAIHTTESPYACAACGARFGWHSCLSRHVRRLHRGKNAAGGGEG